MKWGTPSACATMTATVRTSCRRLPLSWDRLSACAAEFLSVHPYFNAETSTEEGSPPTIELLSSDSISSRLRERHHPTPGPEIRREFTR